MSDVLSSVRQAFDLGMEGIRAFAKASNVLSNGPTEFYFERIQEYVEGLFSLAPCKEGDRVTLISDQKCTGGWRGYEHFLCVGAVGEVVSIDYHSKQFWADVVFDNESWIDDKGVKRPVVSRHAFRIRQADLSKVTAEVIG